jgi:ankyrin repeat protein
MKRVLPTPPNLGQLKNQAKDLLKQIRSGDAEAVARLLRDHPRRLDYAAAKLSDAQLVIAREYGFASWPKLKRHVEDLENLETRVARLRSEFASGDAETKLRLLKPAHDRRRFENYDPSAASISDADARLVVANEEGYAFWSKYESYLHLDPDVKDVIRAVRCGDLEGLRKILRVDPAAANPQWAPDFPAPVQPPNDSIPLFCVSEGVWRGTNTQGNDYDLTHALLEAGADIEIHGDLVITGAASFNAIGVMRALLNGGARVDGVDGDGVPMAYAMHFGFRELAELMAKRGAKLDLRFAAGLGRLDLVQSWFNDDGSLKEGAGALADPYGFELKRKGKPPFQCERTRRNILSQALYFACVHQRLEVADFLLAQGAEINAIVPGLDSRATVLHQMVYQNASELAALRFLVERGADSGIPDLNYRATALEWARHFRRDEAIAILSGITLE